MKKKFQRQDAQYALPYHYLVSLDHVQVGKIMDTGVEYFCYMRKAIDLIESHPYDSLLDVGCGDGRLVSYLAPRNTAKKYVGADPSERAILLAQGLNYGLENASFVARGAEELTEEFDVLACVETMEHIPDEDMQQFTQGMYDRLKVGGRLVVTVPSIVTPLQKKHYRHYDIELLDSQLHQFDRLSVDYAMKTGLLRNVCVRLSRKFTLVNTVQSFVWWLGRNFVFEATSTTGRHVVAVYTKK